eukprot:ctg_366.g222
MGRFVLYAGGGGGALATASWSARGERHRRPGAAPRPRSRNLLRQLALGGSERPARRQHFAPPHVAYSPRAPLPTPAGAGGRHVALPDSPVGDARGAAGRAATGRAVDRHAVGGEDHRLPRRGPFWRTAAGARAPELCAAPLDSSPVHGHLGHRRYVMNAAGMWAVLRHFQVLGRRHIISMERVARTAFAADMGLLFAGHNTKVLWPPYFFEIPGSSSTVRDAAAHRSHEGTHLASAEHAIAANVQRAGACALQGYRYGSVGRGRM